MDSPDLPLRSWGRCSRRRGTIQCFFHLDIVVQTSTLRLYSIETNEENPRKWSPHHWLEVQHFYTGKLPTPYLSRIPLILVDTVMNAFSTKVHQCWTAQSIFFVPTWCSWTRLGDYLLSYRHLWSNTFLFCDCNTLTIDNKYMFMFSMTSGNISRPQLFAIPNKRK